MPEEDAGARELNHAEEVLDVIFPPGDGATTVVEPGEEALDFPAPPPAAEGPPILRGRAAAAPTMGGDHLDAVALADERIERIAGVATIADQSRGEFREEAGVEGGGDKVRLIR